MKVLLANHHFFDYSGTETYLYTLAIELQNQGCDVSVYSPYTGGTIAYILRGHGVPIYQDLDLLQTRTFDVIQVSHNLIAHEVRERFSETPMVYLSHGVLPFFEQPPFLDLNIALYLAVSEEVRDNLLTAGIPAKQTEVVRNLIDTERFVSYAPIRPKAEHLLVLSRRMDPATRLVIEEASARLGLQILSIGSPREITAAPESFINRADIVVSLGRGALEAMACGRAVLIYDYQGGDGFITQENISEVRAYNFSGRYRRIRYSVESLVEELTKYSPSMGVTNRKLVEEGFSARNLTARLIKIYDQAIRNHQTRDIDEKTNSSITHYLRETRIWSMAYSFRKLEAIIQNCEESNRAKEHALLKHIAAGHQKDEVISALQRERQEREAVYLECERWREAFLRSWLGRLYLFYLRFRDWMAPHGTRRRKWLKSLVDFFRGKNPLGIRAKVT